MYCCINIFVDATVPTFIDNHISKQGFQHASEHIFPYLYIAAAY